MVFSIDDEAEFKADFVLATLNDIDPATSATNGTSTTNTHTTSATTVRQKPASHKKKEATRHSGRGRRRAVVNGQGLTRNGCEEKSIEDEWSNPFSRSSGDRARERERERTGENTSRERVDTERSSEDSSSLQQTGSRLREEESVEVAGRVSDIQTSAGACGEVVEGGGGDMDHLDALFGEENMMDVGEGGWEEGGWGRGFATDKQTHNSEPQHPHSGDSIHLYVYTYAVY